METILRAPFAGSNVDSRSDVLHRWNRRILKYIGVEVAVCGPIPAGGLIASNHLSYLDILVLSATARCFFVSKSEVKSWPLVGWIAALTGTVFVDRSRRSPTHNLQPQMQERLESGELLVLFPEGTSSDGGGLLPFHSSFFESAVAAAAPITATYLSYELPEYDGDPKLEVCYWGDMILLPHLIKLLTKSKVRATVKFASEPQMFSDRKEAALEIRRRVLELAQSGDAQLSQHGKRQSTLAADFH
jgi:lyso-ornithine lipid O-acyltransferase